MDVHFETLLAKFGEHGILAILENWERFEGFRPAHVLSLETRWENFLNKTAPVLQSAAA